MDLNRAEDANVRRLFNLQILQFAIACLDQIDRVARFRSNDFPPVQQNAGDLADFDQRR